MSVADAFISKYSNYEETKTYNDDIDVRPSVFEGTTYATRSLNFLNPRQNEFYLQQKAHQERLNYLHFKYRMNEENGKKNEDSELSHFPLDDVSVFNSQFSKRKPKQASEEDLQREKKLSREEQELQKELHRQQVLLQETKTKINDEIDRVKLLLEKFRRERNISMKNLENEYSRRKERYETDITTIKNTEIKKPEININIVKEKHSTKSQISKTKRPKNSTEILVDSFSSSDEEF